MKETNGNNESGGNPKKGRLSGVMAQDLPSTPKQWAVNILVILLATMLYACALKVFTAPNQIAPGGVTGISTIINYLTGFPIGTVNLILNIPIAILGFIKLGRHIMIKTIIYLLSFSFFSDILFAGLPVYTNNRLVAAVFGGALMGCAIGLIMSRGGSTGGMDIVNKLIQRRLPHLKLGQVVLASDVVIVILSMLAYQDVEPGLFALITMFISSTALDKVLYGFNTCKFMYIIADDVPELGRRINQEMHRGATILESYGSYTNERRPTLMVAVRQSEYYRIKKIINQVDPMAFVIVTSATEVAGKGFTAGLPRS